MSRTKEYAITKRHQLIDLNQDNVNFKLDFMVQTVHPEDEFQAIVVTQEQLNQVDLNKIEMKNATHKINGSITANNNKYQNYFLVLKKKNDDKPDFNAEVSVLLEKLEPVESEPKQAEGFTPTQAVSEEDEAAELPPFYRRRNFWIGLVVILALLGLFVYYRYFYNKTGVAAVAPALPVAPAPPASPSGNADVRLYDDLKGLV
jgi:hypothetical protein